MWVRVPPPSPLKRGNMALTYSERLKLDELYPSIKIGSEWVHPNGRYYTSFKLGDKNSSKLTAKLRLECMCERSLSKNETVDHIDGDKTNDSVSNLRLLSRSENIRAFIENNKEFVSNIRRKSINEYYDKHGSLVYSGDNNSMSKISNDDVERYRNMFHDGLIKKEDIITETKMSRRAVENFLRGVSYKHVGGKII